MKKSFIISLVAFFCFAGSAQAQNWGADLWGPSLIDNTYMGEYKPIIPTYTEVKMRLNDGTNFEGKVEKVDGRVTAYIGTRTMQNGSYFFGYFDPNFRPIRGGWYVENNIPYYQIYDNYGNCISKKRIETYGRRYYFLDPGESGIRYFEDSYVSGYNNNSNSYNNSNNRSSSNNSYNRSNNHRRQCHACHGSGRLKKSVPNVSGYGISTKKYYCNECGETSMSQHIHINCTYCR